MEGLRLSNAQSCATIQESRMSDLLNRLEAMNATKRKAAALAEYEAACAAPSGADWETIAHALRKCFPAPRQLAPMTEMPDDCASNFTPWYDSPKRVKAGSGNDWAASRAEITFADGRTIRAHAMSHKSGKPNIAGACRAACDLWRTKALPYQIMWTRPVPEIVRVCIPETGAEYDPAAANEATQSKRLPDCERTPSAGKSADIARARLDWFSEPDAFSGRLPCDDYHDSFWRDAMPDCPDQLPEAMPEPMPQAFATGFSASKRDETAPAAEALNVPEKAAAVIRSAMDRHKRALLASTISGPMEPALAVPCAILARPFSGSMPGAFSSSIHGVAA
jgi:hypothetical protein